MIATEATKALATRLSSVSKVRAYCHPENKAAHAVAINSGFLSKGMAMHKNLGIEGLLFSLNQHLDAPIGQIADPSLERHCGGFLGSAGAVPDALNAT